MSISSNSLNESKTQSNSMFVDVSSKTRSLGNLSFSVEPINEERTLCEVTFANGHNLKLSTAMSESYFRVLLEEFKNA